MREAGGRTGWSSRWFPFRVEDHVRGAAGGQEPAAAVGDSRLAERDRAAALEDAALGDDVVALAGGADERDVDVERGLIDPTGGRPPPRGERAPRPPRDERRQ